MPRAKRWIITGNPGSARRMFDMIADSAEPDWYRERQLEEAPVDDFERVVFRSGPGLPETVIWFIEESSGQFSAIVCMQGGGELDYIEQATIFSAFLKRVASIIANFTDVKITEVEDYWTFR